MEIDIANFLPKYPNTVKHKDDLFNMYDDNFYTSIYRKREFYNVKLAPAETIPQEKGDLMNHQKIIARFFSSHTPYDRLLLVHDMGCLAPNTPVLLYNGDVKNAKDVKEGDLLISDNGKSCKVMYLIEGKAEMFKVEQKDCDSYTVNGQHILTLKVDNIKKINKSIKKFVTSDNVIEIKVKDYIKLSESVKETLKGYKCNKVFWNYDDSIKNAKEYKTKIPIEYIVNSEKVRIEILSGMISVFNKSKNRYVIYETDKYITNQILYLARSLGIKCSNNKKYGIIHLFGNKINLLNPEALTSDIKSLSITNELHTNISITSVGEGSYYGWELDHESNGRFLLGDFTVTHNTGKTCSAIGAIERIRSENSTFKKAVILAKGTGLLNNFMNELIFKCTDGRYIPEDYENLSNLKKTIRKKKQVEDYYKFDTFEMLAKSLSKMSDETICKRYNNSIFVFDEIHNIRIKTKPKTKVKKVKKVKRVSVNKYKEIHRLLHVVKNCKVLFLSGTPMKDSPEEIASVMNLLLPMNKQLPNGKDFINEFMDQQSEYKFTVKKDKIQQLKDAFKGRVSYMKAIHSNVNKIYEGFLQNTPGGKLKYFNLIPDEMSTFQSKSYDIAYKNDFDERKGVYSESRQASLFVFPDGTWGKKGWNKYIIDPEKKKKKKGINIILKNTYMIGKPLKDIITGGENDNKTIPERLKILKKYSSKYAKVIENLLESYKNGQKSFVYGEFVTGSGIILFSMLLKLFGFKNAGNKKHDTKELRYSIVTNKTSNPNDISRVIKNYNDADNLHGEYVSVIIGSRVISEGFSLMDVQTIEILTPWFNYSETAQAIARGLRVGSHDRLISEGVDVFVRIFRRASISKNNNDSIDLLMYKISEDKDLTTEYIKRLIKISAFDCALTYERNHLDGYDYKRECEYLSCDYECEGIKTLKLYEDEIDSSTYNLYYIKYIRDNIIIKIIDIFQASFTLSLDEIKRLLGGYTTYEVVSSLSYAINTSIQFINMYGSLSYLREENNLYYLIGSLSVKGQLSDVFYTKHPSLSVINSFSNIVDKLYYKTLSRNVIKIFKTFDNKERSVNITKLPPKLQQTLLENCILYNNNKNDGMELQVLCGDVPNIVDKILLYFKEFYKKYDDTWVSWYQKDSTRCLIDGKWKECDKKLTSTITKAKKEIIKTLEKNKYGYYGQYNPNSGAFCIKDVRKPKNKLKHKQKKGTVCKTSLKKIAVELAINTFKLSLHDKNFKKNKSKKELWADIMDDKRLHKMYDNIDNSNIDKEEMRRILFIGKRTKEKLCQDIMNFMKINNMIVIDTSCGNYGRKND